MPLTDKRILLVDDHELMRRMVTRLLRGSGGNVECAANGREAVDRLALESFDVVLMDYNMPEMNGLEAAAYIRDRSAMCIVLMSSDDISRWATRLGCAFALKGRDLAALPTILADAMAEARARGRTEPLLHVAAHKHDDVMGKARSKV